MVTNFLSVTELAGDDVTQEQIDRMYHRYYWAGDFCLDKDVLEVACGTGQGAGYLCGLARTYSAGDYSEEILKIARAHYGPRVTFRQFDAQDMPFPDKSLDVVILFEAIYYLPSAERFAQECRRVLRPGGKVLIASANKDLYDFNPSPHSYTYYGVTELAELFGRNGFVTRCLGYLPLTSTSLKQKMLRPLKKILIASGLMPKTMAGKKFLKRLVFGALTPMPSEISPNLAQYSPPRPVVSGQPDRLHKVIYCIASL